jgi:hypothetical protein
MSAFEDARAQLAQAQAAAATARAGISRARNAGRGNPALAANLTRANAELAQAVAGFGTVNDPRSAAQQLADSAPFVLLPVRLETRFGSGRPSRDPAPPAGAADHAAAQGSPQLWVRIYPDDCSIDTFEADLTATELTNVKRYWQAVWRAAGDTGLEQAAWADLVAAHGSGRAGYLVDTFQPVNPADRPGRAAATDEFLVIATQTALSAAEATAVAQYWSAVWVASTQAELDAALAALTAAVGAARATQLVAGYVPGNLADAPVPPATRTGVAVTTVFVVFPSDPPAKPASWTEAPQVAAFPDRFVVLGYRGGEQVLEALGGPITLPLYVGPDPSADPDDAIHPAGPDLVVPDQLSWLVDFDAAVAAGLGIAVDIAAADAQLGFDRLLVLGVSLAADAPAAAATLGELLTHHHIGRAGLSLIPQGTPAHNVAGATTGYTRLDDAAQSFADRQATPLFTVTSDPDQATDGQWLARALGIDPAVLQAVHAAGGLDQARGRAMQRALWPATLGYWLDKLLAPTFSDQTVAELRSYFSSYVRGRGALPAIRIGAQAYGVLPTTAFSRIGWLGQARAGSGPAVLAGLLGVLRLVQADWAGLAQGVSRVGSSGDAHQILLDILGLHPDSAEYYWRYSQGLTELYNVVNLWGLGPQFWTALVELGLQASGTALLSRLGDPNPDPDLLRHAFFTESGLIGTIVDDRPASETDPVRFYTDDHRNYLQWLADTAATSLDDVVAERGFSGDVSPQALLYLYLRHAILLGYYDTSYNLHRSAGFLTAQQLAAMKPEAPFVHIDAAATASESRYAALYKTEPRITSSPTELVADYITSHLAGQSEAAGLADQIAALGQLAGVPTAELERLFAEHVDTATYRLDAWLLGLPALQLDRMRAGGQEMTPAATPAASSRGDRRDSGEQGNGKGPATGCYLGAYAWLEDLRPAGSALTPAQPPADVAADFAGTAPLLADPANGGYIHAPSLPHARSAAVLRSGYLANASTANPDTLAVNLSSDRVRLALETLEGMRNGQSIGALLGYRFERGLHDSYDLAEVDKFIFPLRKAFPLVADSIAGTQTPPDVPIEAIEASNVLDGRKLIARIDSAGVSTYPFGLTDLPAATAAEAAAINAQVQAVLDVNDAIADVALAEGVHQAVQGNFDRVAATLDAYGVGSFPPDPEVVQTPAPGIGLTHRVAVHLPPGLTAPATATPRSVAEPALDSWLAGVLPDPAKVGATVTWTDPIDGVTARSAPVTLADLDLGPLDVVDLVRPDDVQAMTGLDDRILRHVLTTVHPRPDAGLQIQYRQAPAGGYSVFEAGALVRAIRALLTAGRPLRATDLALSAAARPDQNAAQFADRTRIDRPKAGLDALLIDLGSFLTPLQGQLADPVANRGALIAGTDAALDAAVELLQRAALLGVQQAGWGFCYDWRQQAMRDLYAVVRAFVARCDSRLAAFDAAISDYDALPAGTPDGARFQALQAAEAQVVAHLDPLPATPADMRAALPAKRGLLQAKRTAAAAVLGTDHPTFGAALTAAGTLLPVDDVDPQPLDFTAFGDRAVTICADIARAVTAVAAAATGTAATVGSQLAAYAAATADADRISALTGAAQAFFGPSFLFLPEFVLAADQAPAWTGAVAAGAGGALTEYLTTTAGISDPVPEWAAGAARVRPALHAWESAGLLAPAFGRAEPALTPAQLPYTAGDPWLAMQFPASFTISTDRLLYTACYAQAFDATAHQCGLLLDEWTEVIPAATKDTGLTFQFSRPDNEPPQAILVVTPATGDGVWHWEDLVAAVTETLDLAKLRAVEPADTDPTPYARLLPATVMAVTVHGISITTALAAANGVMAAREVIDNA